MIADASVVRSGRNLTVVSIEIRSKETNKLSYTAQATLFHLPTPKLWYGFVISYTKILWIFFFMNQEEALFYL